MPLFPADALANGLSEDWQPQLQTDTQALSFAYQF
jgi:hypothetical protein